MKSAHPVWRKSTSSQGGGTDCVEVADLAEACGVRDSKDPDGPVLSFTRKEWAGFLSTIKSDRYDLPA
ncbi:DUF397 domain-containing protein [Actinomadura barringtoniae]|uniref:DUF397 domain-containing protein n=1 Tax=Actinomadura barringtoniae TaxID=1427535 RepID=A0A939T6D2_9ACTN|nr:DUF397 domain-containing protein [Actinomadura barringtoniae]MBO2451793.1 DUF397 domain-containing protein [Actinomadura barringtoniae]